MTTNLGRFARSISGCQWRLPTRTLSSSTNAAASIGKRDLPAPRHLPFNHAESQVMRTAMQELQRQKNEIVELERMLDTFRIASLPARGQAPRRRAQHEVLRAATLPGTGTGNTASSTQNQGMQHTFQVMNRNARKAKRANHGKRPCSRIRRRYKVKKWANTSRGRG